MRKNCGNCANHREETNQFSEECGKCVSARLENGEITDPSHWREKPQTNADRIQAMSDKELAEFIRDISHCCEYADRGVCFRCPHPWCSSDDTEKWLKQPAEVDNGQA